MHWTNSRGRSVQSRCRGQWNRSTVVKSGRGQTVRNLYTRPPYSVSLSVYLCVCVCVSVLLGFLSEPWPKTLTLGPPTLSHSLSIFVSFFVCVCLCLSLCLFLLLVCMSCCLSSCLTLSLSSSSSACSL